MTTETTPMQDLSNCCEGRKEMTNEESLEMRVNIYAARYTMSTILVGH